MTSKIPISKNNFFFNDEDYLTDPSHRSSEEDRFYEYYYDDKCNTNEFQCDDGSCVHKLLKCDGFPDCNSGEDEVGCNGKFFIC